MDFKFIDSIFPNLNFDLEILAKDSNLYSTLLFQHKGIFHVEENKFGNQNDCTNLFNNFAKLAKDISTSLAVTPEYSCPWETITEIIKNIDLWPKNKKLWAFGCESITPKELAELKKTYSNGKIIIHFDEEAFNNGGGAFVDPLCYIFKAKDKQTGNENLILLVQFKTQHMGVWSDDVEQERYIPGNEIYVLRNNIDSIYLFTIICSEVSCFKVDYNFVTQLDHRWDENPYIILNIQMNPKPSHQIFKSFRNNIMLYPHKDIISLNWAKGSIFSDNKPILTYSKSAITFKSDEMDFDFEDRFISNHLQGLYYTYKNNSLHTYYLNSSENIFHIRCQKPAVVGINRALSRRTGPESITNYQWNGIESNFCSSPKIDDDFINFLKILKCTSNSLRDLEISVLDKERLINITTGKVESRSPGQRWHSIDKLFTFLVDDSDTVNRLTFIHDEEGKKARTDYIEYIDTINDTILKNPSNFPDILSAFKNNCNEIMFFKNDGADYNYKFNLATIDGQHKATVAFIGRTDEGAAEKTLIRLQKLYDKNDQSRKLVVVWYKESVSKIAYKCASEKPRATDDTSHEFNSILKN